MKRLFCCILLVSAVCQAQGTRSDHRAIYRAQQEQWRAEAEWKRARILDVTPAEPQEEMTDDVLRFRNAAHKKMEFDRKRAKQANARVKSGAVKGPIVKIPPELPKSGRIQAPETPLDSFTRWDEGTLIHRYHAILTIVAIEADGIVLSVPPDGEKCKILCEPPKEFAVGDKIRTPGFYRVGPRAEGVTQLTPVNVSKWLTAAK